MSRNGIILLSMMFPSATLWAEEAPARVRARVTTEGDIWVGQRVTLALDLLSPTPFSGAPDFELPDVPGALLFKPEDRPTLGTEQVGDVEYTVQRHEFAVFAQRAGTIRVASIAVRFASSGPPGQTPVAQRLVTEPLSFAAKMPPGAEGLATVISTNDLDANDSWEPQPGRARVGDAFTRRMNIRVQDYPAMAIPAPKFERIPGLGVYAKGPTVSDKTERGELVGRRTDTVTYVCEKPGTMTIPGQTLTWWDLDDRQLKRVHFPGRTIDVQPVVPADAADSRAGATAPSPRSSRLVVLLAMLLVGVLLVSLWAFRRPILSSWGRLRAAFVGSESADFARFRRACRAGDARTVHQSLVAWLDRASGQAGSVRVESFAARAGDPELTAQLAGLEAQLFGRSDTGSSQGWSPTTLGRLVGRARRRLKAKPNPYGEAHSLAPLNPT